MVANCGVQIKVIDFHFYENANNITLSSISTTVFPAERFYIFNLLTVFVRFIILYRGVGGGVGFSNVLFCNAKISLLVTVYIRKYLHRYCQCVFTYIYVHNIIN